MFDRVPSKPKPALFAGDQPNEQDYLLPQDQVCVPRESAKYYAFCQTGSVTALQSLLNILKV